MMLFIKIVLFIVLLIGIGLGLISFPINKDGEKVLKFGLNSKMAVAAIAGVLLLVVNCAVFVPANTVGIRWSVFGGTSETTLSEGLAFKTPFDKVYEIPTTVRTMARDNVTVQTKDSQWVSMAVEVKYQVDKINAFKVFKNFTTLDTLDASLIPGLAQKSIEEVTTEYNIIELLGDKRNEIYGKIEENLSKKLAAESVTLKSIVIIDTDAGEAIEKAIADEAVAKKEAETAEQKKLKAEIEAQTKLIQAEGEAKANAVKTKELTDKILAEQWIQKWDGKLPTVAGSEGTMIDISKLLNSKE